MVQAIKCSVIGDGMVGKTCLLISYTTKKFPNDYIPTVFGDHPFIVMISGHRYILNLFDTAGGEDYDRLRPLSYPGTDVFLVCFSVINPTSFENVKDKWVPEIQKHCPKVPFILVGTIADKRKKQNELSSDNKEYITEDQGSQLAKKLNSVTYVDCSALTGAKFDFI